MWLGAPSYIHCNDHNPGYFLRDFVASLWSMSQGKEGIDWYYTNFTHKACQRKGVTVLNCIKIHWKHKIFRKYSYSTHTSISGNDSAAETNGDQPGRSTNQRHRRGFHLDLKVFRVVDHFISTVSWVCVRYRGSVYILQGHQSCNLAWDYRVIYKLAAAI